MNPRSIDKSKHKNLLKKPLKALLIKAVLPIRALQKEAFKLSLDWNWGLYLDIL
jgi:hypothetical protein